MPRLRRSNPSRPGITRKGAGRGFAYYAPNGMKLGGKVVERIAALAIPPAWTDVWICTDEHGHLQAVGTDDAGRRQYLYHEQWRAHRDRDKFRHMTEFAADLPNVRRRASRWMGRGSGLRRERVLGCAVRMLDLGAFRVGGEAYADRDGGIGLATLHKNHVAIQQGVLQVDAPGKGGQPIHVRLKDSKVVPIVRSLKRSKHAGNELFGWRDHREWIDMRASHVNEALGALTDVECSAKDFRTWNATVLMAAELTRLGSDATSERARNRAIRGAYEQVAEYLCNTPAIAKSAYVDPRIVDAFRCGWTLDVPTQAPFSDRHRTRVEAAVLDALEAS